MTLRIYNTLTQKKEIFTPVQEGKVRMYVCGPTVYDSSHIGHARSVVVFDVIVKYFKAKGFNVNYIRNFTDVDDKIINRANELGVNYKDIALKYIDEFHEDMKALNVESADIEPKASEHIEQIIKIIKILIEKEHAYIIDNDVFFNINSFKDYGKLSKRKLDEMEAGTRVDIDKRKKNPFDFALWKSAKPDEPFWNSPWGKGRPGWHIECSAMSCEYLGETFDIHGGGKDLIFPHHENEIAQSEAANEKNYVNYWIHNGFVNINQEKMSKSLGNFKMIKEVIKLWHPEAVRLFLLSNHYRSPLDFTEQSINEAQNGLDKIYSALDRAQKHIKPIESLSSPSENNKYVQLFNEAMDDDFNTAKAISIVFDIIRNLNKVLDNAKIPLENQIKESVIENSKILKYICNIIGILSFTPEIYFKNKKSDALKSKSIDIAKIENMIHERRKARKEKDYAMSDKIRDDLMKLNIILEDMPDGTTTWKISKKI